MPYVRLIEVVESVGLDEFRYAPKTGEHVGRH
jgi:hypothetical protein